MKQLLLVLCLALSLPTALYAQKQGAVPQANPGYLPTGDTYIKSIHQFGETLSIDAVKAYLRELLPQMNNLSDYTLLHDISSPGGRHLTFAQTFAGIPVYGATVKVNLNKSNRCTSVLNGGFNLSEMAWPGDIVAAFDDKTLQQMALQVVGGGQITDTRFVWWVDAAKFGTYCFQAVSIHDATECSSNDILLDAATGKPMTVNCLAVYFRPVDTTAQGMVFMPDPLTSAGVPYGGQYRDNNDADNAALNAERVEVTLLDVSYEPSTGVYSLTGPHVRMLDIESPTVAVPTSTNGEFFFTRSQSGFEDVNVYYHMDGFQRRVQSFNFFNLANFPLRVDAHGNNGDDNSYFIPNANRNSTYISFGEGGIDDAEDADVIVHEYGHALSYAGSPSSNSGTERRGLDEGFGDYFAASYSRNINDYNWQKTFSWDGNEFWNGRSCAVTRTYPQLKSSFDANNIYAYGELWATCLMKAWTIYGPDIMDPVAFQELYSNNGNQTVADAARLLIDADTLLFNGEHTPGIVDAFCSLQVLTGSYCAVASALPSKAQAPKLNIAPNPISGGSLQVSVSEQAKIVSIQLLDLTGRLVLTASPDLLTNGAIHLDAHDLPSGLYILQAELSDGTLHAQKILKP